MDPVRSRYRHWLFRLPLLRRYRAICLGRTIYYRQSEAEVTADARLLRHEAVHQAQIARYGRARFYAIYLRDYCRNWLRYRDHDRAYREIPFEVEARAGEDPKA